MRPVFIFLLLFTILYIPATLLGQEGPKQSDTLSASQAKEIINRVYLDVLQRYPDEKGLYTYENYLVNGGKNEDWLRQVLQNSEEGKAIAKERQKKTFILSAIAALPFLFIILAFYFRKNTRDFIVNSLLVLFSICVACLLLEFTLRVTAAYKDRQNALAWSRLDAPPAPKNNAAVFLRDMIQLSADPGIVYELIPNLSVRFMGGRVTIDKNGFRVTPGSCDGPKAFTIVGLGDSVMFGWGVNDEETYLAYLAQSMSGNCIRILNMAVPGYNTAMEVEAFRKKGVELHPDLVIIHYVDNDLFLPNFIRKQDKHITLTRSYLVEAISRWRGTRIRTRPFDHLVRNSGEVPDEYQYMVGVDGFQQAMQQLEQLSRDNNFKILLLTNWTAPDFVQDVASEYAIPVIELGVPLQKYCRDNNIPEFQGSILTVSKNDPHYSPIANRIVADTVYNNLRQNDFLAKQSHPTTKSARFGQQ